MKKTLLFSTALAAIFSTSQAQVFTNAGFETWANITVSGAALEHPASWYGSDSLVHAIAPLAGSFGFNITPGKQLFKSTDAHSGSFAAEVRSIAIGSTVGNAPGIFTNASIGIDLMAAIGDDPENILDHLSYTGGTSVTAKVDTVSAWVKAGAGSFDTALVQIRVVKSVNGADVELGTGFYSIPPSTTQYTQIFVPITYTSTDIPDKLLVAFLSSDISADSVHAGNSLFVDDVAYSTQSGTVSIRQPLFEDDQILVYPNPATNVVYFNLNSGVRAQDFVLSVMDVAGRVVFTENLKQQINPKSVAGWAKGNYFFNLTNAQNGKFEKGQFVVK